MIAHEITAHGPYYSCHFPRIVFERNSLQFVCFSTTLKKEYFEDYILNFPLAEHLNNSGHNSVYIDAILGFGEIVTTVKIDVQPSDK